MSPGADPRSVVARIGELEAAARTALSRRVVDYVAGGAGEEIALGEAVDAWRRYRFAPHALRDVTGVDAGVDLFGRHFPSPVGVAPVGYARLLHPDGESALAAGAGDHLFVLSARSDAAVADVAAARGTAPWWYQVYVTADRAVGEGEAARAVAAGATALVLTADTPYVAAKARQGRLRTVAPGADQAPATLADLRRLTGHGLPVLVKGVLRGDDARRFLDAGAAGLVVSNHGGRQLDRTVATADALPEVVAAAGRAPVLVDGGLRSGHDVLVALALGAAAVLTGRPPAWALAAGGGPGVDALLTAWSAEVAHVLGLAGCRTPADVTPDLVRRG
ncbi:4-hydroxymandelate oxidase [Jatrophihabitans endophyticus]|uniref:4-hydroxymandelate oxidase n=1 Tax=Jatrophihabitans endophyticus TaxID=1206085 RepID=A0A1M5MNJ7_9ACTN|nr:alpha-hydroxy acid oxidase [Jatrophihabitans endophyticus]SHG78343.1 4-hydroxymandelate oxidase [Jatrophihabitans endophyticus]